MPRRLTDKVPELPFVFVLVGRVSEATFPHSTLLPSYNSIKPFHVGDR